MIRRLGFGLSREIWLVQGGVFLNMLGYGAVFPYEVVYLHAQRGFSLSVAGLVVGVLTGGAVLTAPVAGVVIDRVGARVTAGAAGVSLAAGYGALALVHSPGPAFVAAAVAGCGNGAMQPAQSTLVAILAPNDVRHRASAVSRVAANFGLGVGAAIGGVVAGFGLRGFQALFFANAATYLVYVLVLAIVVREKVTPRRFSRGYRTVLGDRVFVGLVLTNVAMIAVGWGVFSWVVPTYAAGTLSIDTGLVGLLLLANAATVVIAQVPVARIAEGRRRAHALALGCACWIVAYALVATAHVAGGYPALMLAAVIIAVGECFHSVALVPLVAQLAPTELRGRYMAAVGLSFLLGLGAGSTVGIPALGRSPALAFWGAAGVAAAAMLSVLALERRLPDEARRTPRVSLPARLAP